MIDSYSVHPIDIDRFGWSIVPEGDHNSWGIIHNDLQTLRAYSPDQDAARLKAQALNEKEQNYVSSRPHLRRHRQS